jgi:hypothetical protein
MNLNFLESAIEEIRETVVDPGTPKTYFEFRASRKLTIQSAIKGSDKGLHAYYYGYGSNAGATPSFGQLFRNPGQDLKYINTHKNHLILYKGEN